MSSVLDLKHVSSVSVAILQDAISKEYVGRIVSNHSDRGVCSTGVWIYSGALEGSYKASAGGWGYNKLDSNLASIFASRFSYDGIKELEAGLTETWFAKHGYVYTTII